MSSTNPTIFLVEDSESVSRLIEFKLTKGPYNFRHFANGREGLEAIQEHKPDMVVLDVMLPGMTGFEILRSIREDAELNDMKVMMLTTKTREEDLERGFEMNVDEYMGKPFKIGEFMMRLKRVLNK